jgi:hypothetical protein
MCVAAGTVADDGCAICDPERAVDGWSPSMRPDPPGLRCRLGRILSESAERCTPRAARLVTLRVRRLQNLLAVDARSRFLRRSTRLARASRLRCVRDEATDLLEQARGYVGVKRRSGR